MKKTLKGVELDETFIVKVQVPLATNDTPMALVYNQNRSFETTLEIDDNIKKQMKGRFKAYFWAGVKGKTFYLGTTEADWQEW